MIQSAPLNQLYHYLHAPENHLYYTIIKISFIVKVINNINPLSLVALTNNGYKLSLDCVISRTASCICVQSRGLCCSPDSKV